MTNKEKILTVTLKDCDVQFFRGSGKGGQKRNKTSNCVRIIHRASGSVGKATESRQQSVNKKIAFRRMAESKKFKDWVKLMTSRAAKIEDDIKREVDRLMSPDNFKVEYSQNGIWVGEDDG